MSTYFARSGNMLINSVPDQSSNDDKHGVSPSIAAKGYSGWLGFSISKDELGRTLDAWWVDIFSMPVNVKILRTLWLKFGFFSGMLYMLRCIATSTDDLASWWNNARSCKNSRSHLCYNERIGSLLFWLWGDLTIPEKWMTSTSQKFWLPIALACAIDS